MKTIAAVIALSAVAFAAPHFKPPTLKDLLASDLVAKAKIHWVKTEADGKRTVVEIQGGVATRVNPGLSQEKQPLKYDLTKNAALAGAIKDAKLGAPNKKRTVSENDRTLELLGEGDDWEVVGSWTYPLKTWQKGKLAAIADELEPLLKVQADVFGTMNK